MLVLRDISKAYGKTKANADVSLTLEAGQIHALLGENGAGKSTLMKILFGLVQPDAGTIELDGAAIRIRSPQDAKARGIGMVQQHFALFDGMTALENIALGLPKPPADLRGKILEVGQAYGLKIDPDALVLSLSAGEKQRIEIVRALLGDPRILVLDEPTSVLTPQEADTLFTALRTLAGEGRGLIFISHKLGEVKALCQAATVLRGGTLVGTCDPRETSTDALAELMIGKRMEALAKEPKARDGKAVVSLRNIQTRTNLSVASLDVRAGEIVGVAGIAGNGQDRLFALLSGEEAETRGELSLNGTQIQALSPNRRRAMGARFVPEERLGHAAIPGFRLTDNTLLTKHSERKSLFGRNAWIRRTAKGVIEYFDVRGGDERSRASSFSGGNLQKFVVGRELNEGIDFLLINQPTWGVDLFAAARIRQEILKMADTGTAVLVISQDLDELMELSDRLTVISGGNLSAARPLADWSVADIGRAMAGEVLGDVAGEVSDEVPGEMARKSAGETEAAA